MDNSNFKKPPKSNGRPATALGTVSFGNSRTVSRAGTRRSNRSPTRSMSRSVQIKPANLPTGNRAVHATINPDTIKDFEAALNSARSIHDAPLTPHQLNLTQQVKSIGAPGYGNK